MAFPYKKALVLGATSGIGLALADRLVENGVHVIAVGRRKENLDAFVKRHGSENASGVVFDITKLDAIEDFAKSITDSHPDLDYVVLNSGIQRMFDFANAETVDMGVIQEEVTTNYISYVALTKAFLPFLKQNKTNNHTSLIFMGSGLALVPKAVNLNYSASKAALHSFVMSLRYQLKRAKCATVKIVEIIPPAVQTELHDVKHQPDFPDGHSFGMPLGEFVDQTWKQLVQGDEVIAIGMGQNAMEGFETKRMEAFEKLNAQF